MTTTNSRPEHSKPISINKQTAGAAPLHQTKLLTQWACSLKLLQSPTPRTAPGSRSCLPLSLRHSTTSHDILPHLTRCTTTLRLHHHDDDSPSLLTTIIPDYHCSCCYHSYYHGDYDATNTCMAATMTRRRAATLPFETRHYKKAGGTPTSATTLPTRTSAPPSRGRSTGSQPDRCHY